VSLALQGMVLWAGSQYGPGSDPLALKASELGAAERLWGSQASSLAKAIAELGRIIKTLYLLRYNDDKTHYRTLLAVIEGRQ